MDGMYIYATEHKAQVLLSLTKFQSIMDLVLSIKWTLFLMFVMCDDKYLINTRKFYTTLKCTDSLGMQMQFSNRLFWQVDLSVIWKTYFLLTICTQCVFKLPPSHLLLYKIYRHRRTLILTLYVKCMWNLGERKWRNLVRSSEIQ